MSLIKLNQFPVYKIIFHEHHLLVLCTLVQRNKHWIDVLTEDLHTKIFIKEINVTIGEEHCTTCTQTSKVFRLKLSQYFSYDLITFKFL